jgi:hypothetical protein
VQPHRDHSQDHPGSHDLIGHVTTTESE